MSSHKCVPDRGLLVNKPHGSACCIGNATLLCDAWAMLRLLQQNSLRDDVCLQDEGFREMSDLVAFYRENAAILRKTFVDLGFSVYGGQNAPYIWVGFPGKPSWDVFAEILEKCNIVTTPGSGFGPAGEGFVRASAFGHRQAFFLSLLPVCWEKRRHCEQPWQVMQTLCTTKRNCVDCY